MSVSMAMRVRMRMSVEDMIFGAGREGEEYYPCMIVRILTFMVVILPTTVALAVGDNPFDWYSSTYVEGDVVLPSGEIGEHFAFKDVLESVWYAMPVLEAARAGIVSGYRDAKGNLRGTFGPSDPVTLAQALKIAVEGAGYDSSDYEEMPDVPNDWYSRYISVAAGENFSFLRCDTCLTWSAPATREQVVQLFADAFRVPGSNQFSAEEDQKHYYTDVSPGSEYSFAIEALTKSGVLSGDKDAQGRPTGLFRPYDLINRAETVKIVMQARAVYGMPGESPADVSSGVRTTSEAPVVAYTDDGFLPSEITITLDQALIIRNDSSQPLFVASDPHPMHTNYAGLNASMVIDPGFEFHAQFGVAKMYGFHNHLNASHRGSVTVVCPDYPFPPCE
jgi:hypothetical protein